MEDYTGIEFLCKKNYQDLEIGNFYKVDLQAFYLKNTHLNINGHWFTTELGDQSFFPSLYSYFFTKKQERKIKLQVIDLQNKFQEKFQEILYI